MAVSTGTEWYKDGTVKVTQNGLTVEGTKTTWSSAGIKTGDIFTLDGKTLYEIKTVDSNTSLTLDKAYDGATASGLNYSIIRNFAATVPSELAARVALMTNKYESYIDADLEKITGPAADLATQYKGTWGSGKSYKGLDIVQYNSEFYTATVNHTSSASNGPAGASSVWIKILKGITAYEIAVNGGYTGTQAEWLESMRAGGDWAALNTRTEILTYKNAGAHNALYRGKNLGNAFTEAQSAAIRAGTFDDMFVGDFWPIEVTYKYTDANEVEQTATATVNFRIAGFDYYLRTGDDELDTHHIVVVPDVNLYTGYMNPTNTTEGGYVGSWMYKNGLARAKALITAAFGAGHVLSYEEYLVNAVSNGRASAATWVDSTVELMDERMVYGSLIFDSSSTNGGSTIPKRYSASCKQLPLFAHRPDLISNRQWYWLRNVVSAAAFASVSADGICRCSNASLDNCGVRPAALIY